MKILIIVDLWGERMDIWVDILIQNWIKSTASFLLFTFPLLVLTFPLANSHTTPIPPLPTLNPSLKLHSKRIKQLLNPFIIFNTDKLEQRIARRCVLLGFVYGDLMLEQVGLVPHYGQREELWAFLSEFVHPGFHAYERLLAADIIHQDCSLGIFIVYLGYGPEFLLASRIPELHLDSLPISIFMSLLKKDRTESSRDILVVLVVDEAVYQAALADACGTQDYYFVLFLHGFGRW